MSQDPETPVTAPGHHVGIPGLVGEADVAPFGMNGNSGQDDAADVGVTHWSETSHGACITKTQREALSHLWNVHCASSRTDRTRVWRQIKLTGDRLVFVSDVCVPLKPSFCEYQSPES